MMILRNNFGVMHNLSTRREKPKNLLNTDFQLAEVAVPPESQRPAASNKGLKRMSMGISFNNTTENHFA